MMHKSIIAAAALATSALVPSAASATSFAFAGSNNTNGSAGNVMTFTGSDNSKVEVSAYSLNGNNLTKATLKQYSGYGLGITNSSDGDHEIDNSGWIDFVVLQFDRVVSVSSLGIFGFGDTDLTWAVGTTATGFNPGTLSFANYNALDNAFGAFTSSAGNYSYNQLLPRPVNGGALTGNLFIVAASMTGDDRNDRSNDSFKLNNLVSTPAVPEPATWGMMMMGLGLAGAMMRRSKANTAVSFA